jgi:hypothetical protein
VARRKAAARGKISIDEPFHKLMPELDPHDAIEVLNTAVRRKLAGLWCNGKKVDPGFFRTHLVLRMRLIAKRRWTAEIEATRALRQPANKYTWRMDAKEIEALRPVIEALRQAPPVTLARRTPGPKPTDDWPTELAAELIHLAVVDPTALRNVDKLVTNIQTDFAKTGRFLPQDPKRVRQEILLLLKRIR